ncbi:unnamed protein product [Didymodactylos carnosus]|uniref:Uncharacterized protein n=1 Tax=Didymodactylos carnosus TaxID=1234261 RepID=A0A814VJY9_9BILA|nr:unnamed protein product [Didymodactylos carnosus]CAF1188612.1 unnamed protein product [Didymodactylos carnosus]CAF3921144.1 unnamed protein product [Didymodactylos carnosus]CAF3952912.1 unnamed protein product [Didymodactylos carnosus]
MKYVGEPPILQSVDETGLNPYGVMETTPDSIKNEDLKDTKEVLSDLTNGLIIYPLIEATKIIDVAWNVTEAAEFGLNEPFFDIVVLRHQQSGHYLLVKYQYCKKRQ